MKNILGFLAALTLMMGLMSTPVMAHQNPCNPCSMQHMKKMNPCSMKHIKKMNPCSMKYMKKMNPCSMKHGEHKGW